METENNRNLFHIMEIKVAQIAARYLLCKQMMEDKNNVLSSGEKDTESPYETYVRRVETAYEGLEENFKVIINNDFFFQNPYPFWWESSYSKSNFYRLKKLAMKTFLKSFANA